MPTLGDPNVIKESIFNPLWAKSTAAIVATAPPSECPIKVILAYGYEFDKSVVHLRISLEISWYVSRNPLWT